MLVVDDDEISRASAAGLLHSLGLAVDVAVNGRQALEMSAQRPYAAVFMDCEMPDVDGYEAVTQLRRREGLNRHTPVIAVTSRPRSVSMATGMDHHISKPVALGELRVDCVRLGLLASERDDSAPSSADLAADTPLLDPSIFGSGAGGYRGPKLKHATEFIEQAMVSLPEIWRAANAGDAGTLRSLALALKPRAESVGAARISVLCDHLSDASAGQATAVAVSIEEPLRRAVAATRAAIRAWADGTESPSNSAARLRPSFAEPSTDARALNPVRSVRVILADDDPIARAAIGAMLKAADWIELVAEASGVQEIVDLAAVEQPNVALLDWMMPGGGGAEAARRIHDHSPDTLIVGITSSDSLEALTAMISAGAACLISKGVTADQLTQTIARALKASAAARAAGGETNVGSAPGTGESRPNEPSQGEGPVDHASVEQLKIDFGGIEILRDLVELFGSQTPDRLIQLRRAVEAGDAAAVSSHAHQLKGGCLTLTANRMAMLCEELEESSRAGSLTGAGELVDQLEVAFEEAHAALCQEVS